MRGIKPEPSRQAGWGPGGASRSGDGASAPATACHRPRHWRVALHRARVPGKGAEVPRGGAAGDPRPHPPPPYRLGTTPDPAVPHPSSPLPPSTRRHPCAHGGEVGLWETSQARHASGKQPLYLRQVMPGAQTWAARRGFPHRSSSSGRVWGLRCQPGPSLPGARRQSSVLPKVGVSVGQPASPHPTPHGGPLGGRMREQARAALPDQVGHHC